MSYVEDLIETRDNLIAKRKEVSASPKRNYSVDGQSFDNVGFYRWLSEEIDKLNQQIAAAQPFEFEQQIR